MGTLSFQLPAGLPAAAQNDLALACLAGGYDGTPVPTRVELDGDRLTATRELDESGYLLAPWSLPPLGRLLCSTATLTERASKPDPATGEVRPQPYQLLVEL